MKAVKWLDKHFEESLLVILLVIIACVSMIQVIIRKIPWVPSLTWAEEFCRFCWIWSVFLSLPYTIRENSMLRVGVLRDLLPQTGIKIVNILVQAINTVCMALFCYYSVIVIGYIKASGEASPAMVWPMWIVYSLMFVGFGLGVFRGIQQIVLHVMHFGVKELSTVEQTMLEAAEETEMVEED